MRSSTRNKILTASATARLTPAEDEQLKQRASDAGMTKSEWCRLTLLGALDTPPWARLLLAEVLALRSVVVKLQADSLLGSRLTPERIKGIAEQADSAKYLLADGRLETLRSDGGKAVA